MKKSIKISLVNRIFFFLHFSELTNGINNRKEHRQQIRQLREQLKQAQIGRHQISEQLKKTGYVYFFIRHTLNNNSIHHVCDSIKS